ncbi:hypothetical protein QU487_08370 [Crenobacter sp. SG2305]|uniref:hypothetical protein n=1 Tax=Crenobacter oryzisoli TaxID=3056844 RepID=UPI0025AA33E1|nr:hypothetical protein [Crenobacter sp. SG2305]MDN0082765.1 hypothetical protein [Crenobacter sp. SG2305]
MRFTNIRMFEERMGAQGVTVAFFTIHYGECVIESAYSKNQKKFLFAFVDHNIGFTCSLNGELANAYINHREAVEQLMHCRNHDRYDPIHFYDFLNDQLPNIAFAQITYQQYTRTAGKAVSNFEDRIFFNHWRNSNMSDKQRNKTTELMGNEVIKFCDQNHVIPIFYPYPTERTLAAFNDFRIDYSSYGIQQ